MREDGLFGLSFAPDDGGLGLTMAEQMRVAVEFGRTTPAFHSALGTRVGIGNQEQVVAGKHEQKAVLPTCPGPPIPDPFSFVNDDVFGTPKGKEIK